MTQTTLRFEFLDSGASSSGESTAQPTASAGNAAAGRAGKAKGFDALRSLDELTGGFVSKMEKAIEGLRKNFRSFQDIWERARQFFAKVSKDGGGNGATRAAAKFIPSEVVKATTNAAKEAVGSAVQAATTRAGSQAASTAGSAASKGGGLILEGKVLSRTALPAGGRAVATAAASAPTAATAGGAGSSAAGTAASVGSMAGPVGLAIAAGIVAGTAVLVYSVKKLIEVNEALKKQFAESLERARDFSPQIQIEETRNLLAEMRQNMKVARRDGENLAKFANAQNEMSRAFQSLKDDFNGALLDTVVPILEFIKTDVKNGLEVARGGLGGLKAATDTLGGVFKVLNKIRGTAEAKAEELPPEGDIIGIFRKAPPLSITWGGRTFTPKAGGEIFEASTAQYQEPLPMRGMP